MSNPKFLSTSEISKSLNVSNDRIIRASKNLICSLAAKLRTNHPVIKKAKFGRLKLFANSENILID